MSRQMARNNRHERSKILMNGKKHRNLSLKSSDNDSFRLFINRKRSSSRIYQKFLLSSKTFSVHLSKQILPFIKSLWL